MLGSFWKLEMELEVLEMLNYVPFIPMSLGVLNYFVRTCPCALNYYILKHLCTLIFMCLHIFSMDLHLFTFNYFVSTFAHFPRTYMSTIM